MPTAPALSVVMPAFNEADLISAAVSDVMQALRERGTTFEVIVVENGSTDDTLELARGLALSEPAVRVEHLEDPDYGGALREGLLAASGETLVMFDVDFIDFDFMDAACERLEAGDRPAIVVGSKRLPGARDERSGLRRVATWSFQLMVRTVFGLGVSDTHGVKVMRRSDVRDLAERCRFRTDLFDTELILRVERAGKNVAEIPVSVKENRPPRTSILRRVPRTLWGLAKLRVVLWRERTHG